jgi:MFS family permease
MLIISTVKETHPTPEKLNYSIFLIKKDEVYEKNVIPAAVVMFLTASCTGLIFVVTPDMSGYLGINNKGWYFVYYVISTILVRLLAGGLSDRIGRRETLIIGISFLITAMLLTAYSSNELSYTIASFIFGIATGISSPTLFAWTADLSPSNRRGIGSGTLFIALELGILFGSFSTLLLYDSTPSTILNVFIYGACVAGAALLYVIWHLIFKENKRLDN